MPKKKKKSRASGDGNVAPNKVSSAKSTTKSPLANPAAVVELLELRVSPSSTPPIKTLKHSQVIVLTPEDADQLDVLAGDDVFLLSTSDTPNGGSQHLLASAMARIHVFKPATSTSPIKSPLSKSSSKLSPGYCHIFPASLGNRFVKVGEKTGTLVGTPAKSSHTSTSFATPTPKTPSTPSSSKSKFSFAKGGGGDLLLSSPNMMSPAKSSPRKAQPSTASVWVVPVESTLGDQLTERICRSADTLTVKTLMTDNPQQANWTGPFSRNLVLAHLVGSHISKGTKVTLSIRGQSTDCEMTPSGEPSKGKFAPNPEMGGLDAIERGIAKMSLEESNERGGELTPATSLLRAVKASTSSSLEAGDLLLYQVTHDTKVLFHDNEEQPPTPDSAHDELKSLVAGMDTVMEQTRALLSPPLLHPEWFYGSSLALRPPKGILLHGPSGTGKSSLAAQLAQTYQREHRVHVEYIHCTTLQSQTALTGQAERLLVKLFASAQKRRPDRVATLVILDDVHLICPRRQGMNVGADRLSATLLALLDGLQADGNDIAPDKTLGKPYPLVVLAITTNPSLLDPALRRPGRLDAEVEVPLPDEPLTRSQILQFLLTSYRATLIMDTDDPEEWIELARLAKGFTGADINLAVKEALRMTILSDQAPSDDMPLQIRKGDIKRAIRSTKPSAIKAVTVEIPRVHWSSIGGMEEVKRQLREAVELPQTHGEIFEKLGIRPPRGVLLYGPPGCSKTLMARALATEGHMNFLAVKGPELLSKWLGESERALASLFRRARLASPSLIFFDEIDAIASKRGGGNGGGERLLSQLLTELDGIQSSDVSQKRQVVVVCATNRPDLLDSALMRPGRIDRMIYVGIPDQGSRFNILQIGLKGKSCADDVDIAELAVTDRSGGLSGAELMASCRDAALMALEESETMEQKSCSPVICMRHMEAALASMERQITREMLDFYKKFQGGESS